MLMELLVQREGDTHVARLENIRYRFTRNEQGVMVCEVNNGEHVRWMLKSSSYRAYVPGEVKTEQAPEETNQAVAETKKETGEPPAKAKRKAA